MKELAQHLITQTALLKHYDLMAAKQKIIVDGLREEMANEMDAIGTTAYSFENGRFSITQSDKPVVIDWDQFYQFIVQNQAYYLLQKRLSESACKDRIDEGEDVIGVIIAPKRTLRVTIKKG